MMAFLECKQLSASPWGFELLREIQFSLNAGEVLGIIGPNGAGKSSLLQLLSGQMPPSAGDYYLREQRLENWERLQLARSVALLPQKSSLSFPFTVAEVIQLGRTPHRSGASCDSQIIEQVMLATDTFRLRERLYTQLSGGEQQRVQLARVCAQLWRAEDTDGRLLLLDEPNNTLDPAHQQMVLELIAQLADTGAAVVLVMHDFNLAAKASDQLLVLNEGRQVTMGSPAEVLTEALFQQVFDVSVSIHRDHGAAPRVFLA